MKIIRTISAILLATLVLVSSTSFIVGIHICMGEVSDVVLLSSAAKCSMEKSTPACHPKVKSSCCEDETIVHNADNVTNSQTTINLHDLAPIILDQPLVLVSEIIPSALNASFRYYSYDTPLRSTDVRVEHHSLII